MIKSWSYCLGLKWVQTFYIPRISMRHWLIFTILILYHAFNMVKSTALKVIGVLPPGIQPENTSNSPLSGAEATKVHTLFIINQAFLIEKFSISAKLYAIKVLCLMFATFCVIWRSFVKQFLRAKNEFNSRVFYSVLPKGGWNLILTRWGSQQMRWRMWERKPITTRLQSINW